MCNGIGYAESVIDGLRFRYRQAAIAVGRGLWCLSGKDVNASRVFSRHAVAGF